MVNEKNNETQEQRRLNNARHLLQQARAKLESNWPNDQYFLQLIDAWLTDSTNEKPEKPTAWAVEASHDKSLSRPYLEVGGAEAHAHTKRSQHPSIKWTVVPLFRSNDAAERQLKILHEDIKRVAIKLLDNRENDSMNWARGVVMSLGGPGEIDRLRIANSGAAYITTPQPYNFAFDCTACKQSYMLSLQRGSYVFSFKCECGNTVNLDFAKRLTNKQDC